jgi:hypothetical protein
MIMVLLVFVAFYLHDQVIIRGALFQTSMKTEQSIDDITEDRKEKYSDSAKKYVLDKTLFTENLKITVEDELTQSSCIAVQNSVVSRYIPFIKEEPQSVDIINNNQADFIRMIEAISIVLE